MNDTTPRNDMERVFGRPVARKPVTPIVPYEQVRKIADEMSERVNQALSYIENTDAYTDELGMVEDILRGLVDLGPIEARYVPKLDV